MKYLTILLVLAALFTCMVSAGYSETAAQHA